MRGLWGGEQIYDTGYVLSIEPVGWANMALSPSCESNSQDGKTG
jgi:hypothetical protein